MTQIYFDHSATTPLDPRVVEAMLPFYQAEFGNPSSLHWAGQQAKQAIDEGRRQVAELFHANPDEITFTGSGTESDNTVLKGVASLYQPQDCHIITSAFEHPAILETCKYLAKLGYEISYLPVSSEGIVEPESLKAALQSNTRLVSVMAANNVIGTLQPITELAQITRAHGALFHTDAVQAAAYLDVDVSALGVDLLSLGAHKLYGPKGVGALYVRKGTKLVSHLTGGGQEFGLRAGTHNVPYIVGFAEALRLAKEERGQRVGHVQPLRDHILGRVLEEIPDSRLTGHPTERLPNHASFVFKNVDGNLLLTLLDAAGFACSSGSACKTGNPEPSEVVTSLGFSRDWALGSLRVTLGKDTQPAEVDVFLQALPSLAERARDLNQG